MTENQIFSCLGFIAAAFMVLMLQACGSTEDAPQYLNNSSSGASANPNYNTLPPATSSQQSTSSSTSTSTSAATSTMCYTNSGYAIADGATVWSPCFWPRTPADICPLGTTGSYFVCHNGAWAPQ